MTVPTQYTGNRGFIGVAVESSPGAGTFGTYIAPTSYLSQKSDTLATDPGNMPVKAFRNTRAAHSYVALGPSHVKGTIVHDLFPDVGILLTVMALGSYTGAVSGGGSLPTTHSLVSAEDGLPSLSIEKAVGFQAYRYTGCLVSKATWKFALNAPVEATYEILGQKDVVNGSPSTYSQPTSEQPFALKDITATIFGGADATVIAAELELDNGVQLDHTFSGQRYPQLVYAGDRTVKGKITTRLTANTNYANAIAGNFGALVIAADNGAAAAAGRSITFTLANIVWDEPAQPLVMGKLTTQDLPFTAYMVPGAVDLNCTIANSRATAYFT